MFPDPVLKVGSRWYSGLRHDRTRKMSRILVEMMEGGTERKKERKRWGETRQQKVKSEGK